MTYMDSFSFDDGKSIGVRKEAYYAVIDTGMSFAMIPMEDFLEIANYLN